MFAGLQLRKRWRNENLYVQKLKTEKVLEWIKYSINYCRKFICHQYESTVVVDLVYSKVRWFVGEYHVQ